MARHSGLRLLHGALLFRRHAFLASTCWRSGNNEVCDKVPYNFQFTALTLMVISLKHIISHRGEVWEVIYMT